MPQPTTATATTAATLTTTITSTMTTTMLLLTCRAAEASAEVVHGTRDRSCGSVVQYYASHTTGK
eukprot:52437-Rhodomonas_salina.1